MNKRLQQFLQAENISQSQFADTVGITRAAVSHILSGRNKPGYDFFYGICRHYPGLNLEWLISGKGKMYRGARPSPEISAPAAVDQPPVTLPDNSGTLGLFPEKETLPCASAAPSERAERGRPRVSKVIVFFEDGSYEELM